MRSSNYNCIATPRLECTIDISVPTNKIDKRQKLLTLNPYKNIRNIESRGRDSINAYRSTNKTIKEKILLKLERYANAVTVKTRPQTRLSRARYNRT